MSHQPDLAVRLAELIRAARGGSLRAAASQTISAENEVRQWFRDRLHTEVSRELVGDLIELVRSTALRSAINRGVADALEHVVDWVLGEGGLTDDPTNPG